MLDKYIYLAYPPRMHTPFFALWRARLAPMGQRVVQLRQQSLCHLEKGVKP